MKRLTSQNIIAPVNEPTEWVSQTVIVKKPDGSIRICLDPQELNKGLVRERYTLPTLDDTIHELSQSTVFSKFDLKHGYWHVKLDEASSKMTTFQASNGRFRWLRLPFGVSVAAEIFQRKLHELLSDLKGVICIADDIILHGKDKNEHDVNLTNFLSRCKENGIKLNKSKTKINVDNITFMGHRISSTGIEIDPERIKSIEKFPAPTNVSKLRTFLGMVNFISRFIPKLCDVLHPLHNLLKNDVEWTWSTAQEDAFKRIKRMILEHNKLAIFDPNTKVTLENDASDYGLGSVLLQNNKPIAYASRSLTSCETRYAQIEKEMLAIVFGLNKFHHYIYGRHINIITDHKPLTFIVKKPLSKASKRLQSMMLKCQDYNFNLDYKPGTKIPIADALSRSPLQENITMLYVNNLDSTSLNRASLLKFKDATEKDDVLKHLKQVISCGWPDNKDDLQPELRPYFNYRDEMSLEDGIITRGERIVVPSSLRQEMKGKIHTGHMGINSCLRRARTHLYWPGMSADIKIFVENCSTCSATSSKQPTQPLYLHSIPNRPWQKLGLDIFTISNRNYLVTVDYFSQFFEVDYLPNMTSTTIIHKLKAHFARYGLPDAIYSDNDSQLVSKEFQNFCKSYEIRHDTSSPGNSKANGAAEAAVKMAKTLMKRSLSSREDPYLALLCHRNTPQEGIDATPAQRLMGRRTKTLIPTVPSLLEPRSADTEKTVIQREKKQAKMSAPYESRRVLPPLHPNDTVRMQPIDGTKHWKEATVVENWPNNSRSYVVRDENGKEYRRDRQFLREKSSHQSSPSSLPTHEAPCPSPPPEGASNTNKEPISEAPPYESDRPTNTTRYGRTVRPPKRYGY